ncbi:MAG: phosphoenolpyruvate carboxykinase (GTP), partial [Rhodocyclaceae bacterium]
AKDWAHGVLVGAAMGSETTAAATGAVGVLRRDSMAMKPFCGYNFADYFAHWLSFDQPGARLPKIFHVNWFRKGADGKFLWPGFGENLRVLEWILGRCEGTSDAVESPVGFVPGVDDLKLDGLELSAAARHELLDVDLHGWRTELADIAKYLDSFGSRLPQRLKAEQQAIAAALETAAASTPVARRANAG